MVSEKALEGRASVWFEGCFYSRNCRLERCDDPLESEEVSISQVLSSLWTGRAEEACGDGGVLGRRMLLS